LRFFSTQERWGPLKQISRNESLIALAYDPATETLLKADANALYRSGDGGQSWQKIAIPSPEDARITAGRDIFCRRGVTYVAGPGLGAVRSDDGRQNLGRPDRRLPSRDMITVAAHTTQRIPCTPS